MQIRRHCLPWHKLAKFSRTVVPLSSLSAINGLERAGPGQNKQDRDPSIDASMSRTSLTPSTPEPWPAAASNDGEGYQLLSKTQIHATKLSHNPLLDEIASRWGPSSARESPATTFDHAASCSTRRAMRRVEAGGGF